MTLPSFIWRYFRHYLGWGLLCLVALTIFAVASAAMLSLLPPMLSTFLGPEAVQGDSSASPSASGLLPGSLAGSALGNLPAVQSAEKQIDSIRGRIQQAVSDFYDRVQTDLGVRAENRYLNPEYFAPVLFVLVFLLRSLCSFVSDYSFQRIGFGVTTDVRNDLYDAILRQSIRFHSQHPSGELYSRVVNDVTKLQAAVSDRMVDLFKQSAMIVVCLSVLFVLHAQLATICLLATPVIISPILRFGRGVFKTSHRSQERMADLSELLTEGIRGNRVVKAFGMEAFESERFRRATARHLRVNLRAQVLAAASSPVIESLAAIGASALLIYAAGLIRHGELTAAQFMTFLVALFSLYDPIRKLNKVNLIFQEARAAGQRVRTIMMVPNEIVDAPSRPPIDTVERGISFEKVCFSYAERRVLDEFSLEINVGEVVALVGPSGAGKSTIVNLLPRFFDPDGGRVTIDGADIRDLPLSSLRALIGVVTQETVLFNDSVRNNIAYGRSDLSLEAVREAATAAYADDFIMQLEQGYDTVIGEAGHTLSGGQRQRLAIARAVLKNAPILLLDEATSQLDTESEVLVQRAISNLMEGRTSLVIAHRLSTITRSDRILVLESGTIVEEGTHTELLALQGSYKRLYDLQFRD